MGRPQPEKETTFMDLFKTIAPYLRARFGDTERGAALVEYALLLALIAVVCIVALTTLGGEAASKFTDISSSL
jgi:pilus assembly protein Flp/PilA